MPFPGQGGGPYGPPGGGNYGGQPPLPDISFQVQQAEIAANQMAGVVAQLQQAIEAVKRAPDRYSRMSAATVLAGLGQTLSLSSSNTQAKVSALAAAARR